MSRNITTILSLPTQRPFWKTVRVFVILTLAAFFVASVFIFLRTAYTAADFTLLFEDGFESDDFSNWDSAGDNWDTSEGNTHNGSKRAEVKGDTDGDTVLLKSTSTEGSQRITLSYWYRIKKSLEEDDHLVVEWSDDGFFENSNTLADYSDLETDTCFDQDDTCLDEDDDWFFASHDLPLSANNNPDFQFRFRADFDAGNDEVFLDDVSLTGEEPEGKISGHKWYDVNGNGFRDPDEPPIENWGIVMTNGDNTDFASTYEDGYYEFSELYDGIYTICEDLPFGVGWAQSYPNDAVENAVGCTDLGRAPWGYEVIIEGDAEVTNLDFRNTIELIPVHAHKFNDLNESGEQDEGELSLPGWEICLEPDGFADEHMWDWWYDFFDNDACQVTDENGEVSWEMPPGQYWMGEQMNDDQNSEGWQQTAPDSGSYYYVGVSDEGVSYSVYNAEREFWVEVDVAEFGNWLWTGEVRAFKYNDVNHNGSYEPDDGDEPDEPIEDWEICLSRYFETEDEDGYEPVSCLETDSNGEVLWTGLPQGDYLLEESEEPGWFPTRDRQQYLSLWPWDDEEEDRFEFGNWFLGETSQIHAAKFYDLDQNGIWDEGEMSLPGWEICVEPDWEFFDEEFEEDFWWLFNNFEGCRQTDESGWARWTNLPPGAYSLGESLWNDEWEWSPTTQDGGAVDDMPFLGPGDVFTYSFGNWIDPGEISAHKLLWPDLFPDEEHWYSWGDQENLFFWGRRGLSWGEVDPRGVLPLLGGWELCLFRSISWWDSDDQWLPVGCKETDGEGSVLWTDLPPGSYWIEEESRPWWRSVSNPIRSFWLNPGDIIEGFNDSNTLFLNWNEDSVPPESHFDDPLDHEIREIIETEIVSLSLTGGSRDNLSGVASVELSVWPAGDPDFDLLRWPAGDPDFDTFRPGDPDFDLSFSKIDCSSNEPTIETEIVSMDLVSVVDPPVTVSWAHDWTPSGPGIYCFRAQATDNNSNVENGVFVGPVAYIQVAPEPEPEPPPVTDTTPPSSIFGDTLDHEIINTEMLSLELSGVSTDDMSGVSRVRLYERKINNADTYPSQSSFFDVFYELSCPVSPDSFFDVFTEINAKSLDGGQNENWSFGWTPTQGTFCFAAAAEDNEGNIERTAYAGPITYIPPVLAPHISQEVTENTPALINNLAEFIVSWVTDHVATSRVIYDTVSHLILGDPPNYGYAFSTVEDPTLVLNHEVVVSGLSPGTTYYYRSVSHGSPESVGGERSTSTTSPPPAGIFPYPFFFTNEGGSPENPVSQNNEPELFSPLPLSTPLEENTVSEVSGGEENPPSSQVAFAPEVSEEPEVTGGVTTQGPSLSVTSPEGSTDEGSPAFQEVEENVTGTDNNTAGPNRFLAAIVAALTPLQWVFVVGILGGGALIGSYVYRLGRKPRVKGSQKN